MAGVLIADYFVVRKKVILPQDLYQRSGFYKFTRSFNPRALAALATGLVVALAGLVIPRIRWLYDSAWFVGFGVAFALYLLLMARRH